MSVKRPPGSVRTKLGKIHTINTAHRTFNTFTLILSGVRERSKCPGGTRYALPSTWSQSPCRSRATWLRYIMTRSDLRSHVSTQNLFIYLDIAHFLSLNIKRYLRDHPITITPKCLQYTQYTELTTLSDWFERSHGKELVSKATEFGINSNQGQVVPSIAYYLSLLVTNLTDNLLLLHTPN